MMDSRIELSGLESIKCGVNPALIWPLMCMPIAIIVASVFFFLNGDLAVGLLLAFCGTGILPIAVLVVVFLSHTQWITTPDGITARGLLRTKTIRWSDITAVRVMPDGKRRIVSDHDDMIIPISSMQLVGSVWQHLRRQGMEQGFELWPSARAFWEPVPDLPEEITWTNPHPPAVWPYVVCRVLPFVLIPIGLLMLSFPCSHFSSRIQPWIWLIVLLESFIIMNAYVPRRVTITPDLLIVDFGRVRKEIPWNRVRLGMSLDSSHRYFGWRCGGVSIPVRPDDAAVGQILWALSYKLRYQPRPSLFLGPTRGTDQRHCIWVPKPRKVN